MPDEKILTAHTVLLSPILFGFILIFFVTPKGMHYGSFSLDIIA